MSHRPVIDGLEFARTGAQLKGEWPVAEFARLQEFLHSDPGAVRYALQGIPEERGKPALSLKAEGALHLTCQRCLEALDWPFRIATTLYLASSEAAVEAEPVQAEGPDLIVAGREMAVRDLVEDELLLALPLAPRHERCAGRGTAGEGSRASAFAGLRKIVGESKH